jgi:uncharacterized membrane-anchored protein
MHPTSFTFALGTAAGDLTASQLHFGLLGSIVFFAVGHLRYGIERITPCESD